MADKMNLQDVAAKALELAKNNGADQARVNISRARFINVAMRDGQLEKATSSIKQALGLSVYMNQRFGVHSTSDLHDMDSFVRRACQLTAKLQPDKWRGLPDSGRMASLPAPDLGTYDPALSELPLEFWLDLARKTDDASSQAAKELDFVSSQGGAYLDVNETLLADSRGFMGMERASNGFALCSLTIMDKEEKRRQGYWYSGSCAADEVLKTNLAEELAQKARLDAVSQLGARPGPSGVFPVVVENQSAGSLLGYLLEPMNGASVYRKTSYLQDSLGKPIASPLLTMQDKPHLKGGFGSTWFDGEGVATSDTTLIDQGVLRHFLLDSYYARALDLKPIIGSTTNLTLVPSVEKGRDELLQDIDNGLLLTGFMGGNFNSTTGDFSFGLSGQWIENGRKAYPVETMNMSGNFKQLWNNLAAVGNDPFKYSSNLSPSLLFNAVQLSGA